MYLVNKYVHMYVHTIFGGRPGLRLGSPFLQQNKQLSGVRRASDFNLLSSDRQESGE